MQRGVKVKGGDGSISGAAPWLPTAHRLYLYFSHTTSKSNLLEAITLFRTQSEANRDVYVEMPWIDLEMKYGGTEAGRLVGSCVSHYLLYLVNIGLDCNPLCREFLKSIKESQKGRPHPRKEAPLYIIYAFVCVCVCLRLCFPTLSFRSVQEERGHETVQGFSTQPDQE